MNKPYHPRPRYVAGDPYQMLAAWAIAQFETADPRPSRRRRGIRSPGCT